MSGIYIPIKVPKGCSGCPIDSDCCTLWQQLPPERLSDTRPRDCPIVVVPDHGRLKDYDQIMKEYNEWFSKAESREYESMFYALYRAINDARTIIPSR